jgi:hypothetical protein
MCVCHSFIKTVHVYNRSVRGVIFLGLTGSTTRFLISGFFHESVSPKPYKGRFEFIQNFAAQGTLPLLLTPVAIEKNL